LDYLPQQNKIEEKEINGEMAFGVLTITKSFIGCGSLFSFWRTDIATLSAGGGKQMIDITLTGVASLTSKVDYRA